MKQFFIVVFLVLFSQASNAQCLTGDCINGQGLFRYKSGDMYSGTFVSGKRHGKGELSFANGANFVGEFSNDLPSGRGILTYRNSSKYLGFFRGGKRSGYGVIYNQEGEVQRCGIWAEGKLVKTTEEELVISKLGLNPSKNNNNGNRLRITATGVEVVDNTTRVKPKPVVTTPPITPPSAIRENVKKETTYAKPQIKIISPANVASRGFKVVSTKPVEVKTNNDNLQQITGIVSAEAGLKELRINGRPVAVGAGGKFATKAKMFPGKNEIYLVATDKKGQVSEKIIEVEAKGTVEPPVSKDEKRIAKAPANQKRLALLIGNANYEGGGALRNPVNDVRAMEKVLKKVGFDVMKYEDLDQRGMKKAIDNYGKQLQNYDVGMFFYAGHGLQVNGINYLVPISGNIENEQDAEYECIETGRVLAKMEGAQTKVNIIMLDACRNNPFERSWTRSAKGKGLASINAPVGSFIGYATAPGTTASDGSGENGLYTENVLKFIEKPGITIEEVFRKVRSNVIKTSNKEQIPWDSSSLTGEFYFK